MRFNSFNLIHKSLRARLYDVALKLQQTYFADVEEAEIALEKVEEVVHQFEQHAHHEDTYVLPAVEAYQPQLVESFEKEHVEDIEIGNRLIQLVKMYSTIENTEDRIACGSAICKAFRDFMVFNINHMQREEIEVNRVLWQYYSDAELLQLNSRITASIPPAVMADTAKWMMRSINKGEAITWLKAVKQSAPDPVFQSLFALTETELPESLRAEVQDAVMEHELV